MIVLDNPHDVIKYRLGDLMVALIVTEAENERLKRELAEAQKPKEEK